MLVHLSLRNIATFEEADVAFDGNLVVITGETGAGKSLLLDALALVAGQRASSEWVRHGAHEGVVSAVFALQGEAREHVDRLLHEAGLAANHDELLIRRHLGSDGRHRAFVNDQAATVSLVQRLVSPLLDIVGQHQSMRLADPSEQQRLLDIWWTDPQALQEMEACHGRWAAARDALAKLDRSVAERAEREAFLRFRLQEIDALRLRPGEYDSLEADLLRVRHAAKIQESLHGAVHALGEGRVSALDQLAATKEALNKIGSLNETYAGLLSRATLLHESAKEVFLDLVAAARDGDVPVDIDALEGRHETLKRAFRRYQCDETGLLALAESHRAELATLVDHASALADAQTAAAAARESAVRCADALVQKRSSAAEALFHALVSPLTALGMPAVQLAWQLVQGPSELSATGWTGWGLTFSANPGEPAKPLQRVASGGELSRLLLAIKSAMAGSDDVASCVFDEVDAGVGGEVGAALGRLLQRVAQRRQVMCITHLPQVASFAEQHICVRKAVVGDRTYSEVRSLSAGERLDELARMLGASSHEVARQHAALLLSHHSLDVDP